MRVADRPLRAESVESVARDDLDACAQRTNRNIYLSLSHAAWTHF